MTHCSACAPFGAVSDIRSARVPAVSGGCDIDYADGIPRRMTLKLKKDLEAYDLSKIAASAVENHGLDPVHKEKALLEYRHFLLMALKAAKENDGAGTRVVPTKNADKIWHAHILHSRDYMDFCQSVFGLGYIHHNPSLQVGSAEFKQAVAATQRVHESMGEFTIDPDYFGSN